MKIKLEKNWKKIELIELTEKKSKKIKNNFFSKISKKN